MLIANPQEGSGLGEKFIVSGSGGPVRGKTNQRAAWGVTAHGAAH